jgi:hypothetical protein
MKVQHAWDETKSGCTAIVRLIVAVRSPSDTGCIQMGGVNSKLVGGAQDGSRVLSTMRATGRG